MSVGVYMSICVHFRYEENNPIISQCTEIISLIPKSCWNWKIQHCKNRTQIWVTQYSSNTLGKMHPPPPPHPRSCAQRPIGIWGQMNATFPGGTSRHVIRRLIWRPQQVLGVIKRNKSENSTFFYPVLDAGDAHTWWWWSCVCVWVGGESLSLGSGVTILIKNAFCPSKLNTTNCCHVVREHRFCLPLSGGDTKQALCSASLLLRGPSDEWLHGETTVELFANYNSSPKRQSILQLLTSNHHFPVSNLTLSFFFLSPTIHSLCWEALDILRRNTPCKE